MCVCMYACLTSACVVIVVRVKWFLRIGGSSKRTERAVHSLSLTHRVFSFRDRLVKYLGDNAITRMLFTPSLLQLVLDQCEPDDLREGMKTMRIVWLCGEVVTVELR